MCDSFSAFTVLARVYLPSQSCYSVHHSANLEESSSASGFRAKMFQLKLVYYTDSCVFSSQVVEAALPRNPPSIIHPTLGAGGKSRLFSCAWRRGDSELGGRRHVMCEKERQNEEEEEYRLGSCFYTREGESSQECRRPQRRLLQPCPRKTRTTTA